MPPPNGLTASNLNPQVGDTLWICLRCDWLPFATETIQVVNPVTQEAVALGVDLDQDGYACATWTVPQAWGTALVQHWSCGDLALTIAP